MKSSLVLFTALGVVLALAILFGIAQTTPSAQAAPALTTTPSLTPTETETITETPIATTTACDTRPPVPTLKKPDNKGIVNGTVVTLKWRNTDCTTKYRVVVRRGAKKGTLVMAEKTKKIKLNTPALTRGYTYYWYVKACARLCSRSATWHFTVPGGSPPPTKAPPGTSEPPPPNGTPVPGSPPGNLLNYQGSSVYLSNDSGARWYFDCSFKWRPYPGTLYTTSLWFYPGEKVKLELQDFNLGQVFKTATYTANGAGFLDLAFDTSSWTKAHHYHLYFTGQSSGVQYCGHFDLPLDGGAPGTEHAPHSAAELKAGRFLDNP